ncbi:triple functional domain protein-like [Stigmatopora argus]
MSFPTQDTHRKKICFQKKIIRADTCKAWCSALTFSHGRCGPTNRVPPGISKMQHVIFGNLLDLYEFHHKTFLKELEKYEHMPGEFGCCFVTWKIQQKPQLPNTIINYLVKPVLRILRYPVLNLLECRERKSELQEALEVMLNISKTTNDAMHLLGGWLMNTGKMTTHLV